MNNLVNKYKQMLEPVRGLLRDPIKGTDIDNKIMSAGAGVARTLPSIARGIAKETIIPAAQAVGNAPAFYLKTLPYAKREAEKSANRYLNQQMAATKAQEMGRYDMAKTLMNNSLQDKRKTESYYQMLDPIRYQMAKESGIGGAKSLLNAAGAGVIKASAAGATTLGARGLAMAKAASVPTAIGGGLGGVFAAASGQNVGEGIGQGIGSGLQGVGLQKFTAPIIDPVVDYVGRGKPVVQKYLARALAQGGLNTAEDNLFSVGTQGKKQNADENVLSFLIGAAISPFTSYNPDQSFLKIVDDRLVFDGKRYRNALGEYAKITGEPLNVVKRKAKQATKYLEEEVPIPLTRGGEIIGYTKIKRINAMMQDQSGGVGLNKPGYFDGGASAGAKPQSTVGDIKVYRGTKPGSEYSGQGVAWNGAGTYFSDSKAEASLYGQVKEHIISLKKPFDLRTNDNIVDLFAKTPGLADEKFNNQFTFKQASDLFKKVRNSVDDTKISFSEGTRPEFKHAWFIYDGKEYVARNITEAEMVGLKERFAEMILEDKYGINKFPVRVNEAIDPQRFSDVLKKQGYDGIIAHNSTLPTGNEYAVFDKSQIKSNVAQPPKPQGGGKVSNTPEEAFGVMAGIEPVYDEDGNFVDVKFNPQKAALGLGATIGGRKAAGFIESTKLSSLRKQVSQELSQNQASAQIAKQARESLGDDLVGKINQLKKVAKTKTFAQGDIETLRASKHGKLTNEVVESIQEARPDLDEAGALDFALSLPTKAETRVRKPAELKTLRELESRQKVEQQLWEQEFGRNLNEKEYRKLENEWLKSYTSENKTTPKIKGKQERAAVRQNEQALRRLESEWASQANPGTIKPYKRGDLGTQQPFEILKDFSKANDKAAWKYSRETAVRNIEDTFGPQAPAVKKFVTDRVEANELASTKFLQDTAGRLKQVVNKNGIRKGSKDDALVFRFAEGRMSLDELKAQSKNWQGIADTATTFRTTYDELLDKINASLTKFGYDPIPKRKDYMTHFQEVGSFFSNFGMMFQDKTLRDNLGDKLPTAMSGINMDTRPGKEFFKYALPRTGDKFTESAIGAMERYLPTASRQIFHTDSVQRVRALQSLIEQRAGAQGKDLSNFNSWLSEYGNLLAGKKSVIDRPFEKVFGRGLLKAGNELRKRTGANMVGGNVASALTNFIPLTQSLATTSKPGVMKGLLGAVSTDPTKISGVESSFLTRRFADFSIDRNWREKAGNAAGWLFKAVDHFVGRTIVGSKFHEGLSKGLDASSAMRQADDYAARVMADRSFGASPTLFNSNVLGALTQFQLEVNNQLSFIMKDIPKNSGYSKAQVASSLGQVVLYSYLFNGLYEKMTGRRPAFDPLGVAIQAGQDYTNEDMKKGQATKNLVGNIAQQVPIVGSLAGGGRLPVSSAIPNPFALANGESTLKKELMKPAANLLLPFGGGQIKKTVEGLRAYNRGASVTDSGRVRYGIEKNPTNLVRTALFGQYSTPEAREYFRAGKAPMGENQSKYALKQPDVSGTINYMQGVKQSIDGKKANQASAVSSIENPLYFDENTGETKVIKVAQVASMPESTNYERALKQKAAWGTVGDIVDNLQGEERSQALKAIGVSETDAVYYNVARQDNDIKYAYLTDFMGNIQDRNQLVQALIAGRKKVNDKNIVSDGVLDQLYDDGLISYSERKQLKAIKDLDTNSRPVAKKSGGSGKKIKAPKVKKIKLTTSGVSERVKRVKQRRSKQYNLAKVKKLTAK